MADKECFENYRAKQHANETVEQKQTQLAQQSKRDRMAIDLETAEEASIRKQKRNSQQQICRKSERAEAIKVEFDPMDEHFGCQSKSLW